MKSETPFVVEASDPWGHPPSWGEVTSAETIDQARAKAKSYNEKYPSVAVRIITIHSL